MKNSIPGWSASSLLLLVWVTSCGGAQSSASSASSKPANSSRSAESTKSPASERAPSPAETSSAVTDTPPAPPAAVNPTPIIPEDEQPTLAAPPSSDGKCLPYEPETVALHGVIHRKTFPGPPNYESVAQGDTPETCYVLKLDKPACVPDAGDYDVAYSNIRGIQLVFTEDDPYAKYRHLIDHRVQATGTLYGQHTGHHHTEVLLMVDELVAAPKK